MKKKTRVRIWAAVFWLAVWEIASRLIGQKLFLVSPAAAAARLAELSLQSEFWLSVAHSCVRIAGGYLLAVLSGVLFAALSAGFIRVRELFAPLMLTIKAVPVASFIILALVFLPSGKLAVLISYLIVLPVVYANTLEGIESLDSSMKEMAGIFCIPFLRRLRFLYFPQVYPYLTAACSTAVGLAWKSGVAAEVIGMPKGSVGEKLQQAKVYLDTPDLFAWTVVIVIVSALSARLFQALLKGAAVLVMKPGRNHFVRMDGPAETGREAGGQDDIILEGISKAYGQKQVFSKYGCSFKKGGMTAVMGPSGTGKTTLFRLLAGLEKPDEGTITGMEGMRISAVFQEDRLCMFLSAEENIWLVQRSRRKKAVTANANTRKGGFEKGGREKDDDAAVFEMIGLPASDMPVQDYSGGMRRRASLLRALLADWDICFLDEPFKGLDENTKRRAMDLTKQMAKGKTVILITHDIKEAEYMGCADIVSV